MSLVSHVNHFLSKPGHEFWLVFQDRAAIVDRPLRMAEVEGFLGIACKAPATGWTGMVLLPDGGTQYIADQGTDHERAIEAVRKTALDLKSEQERYRTDPAYALEKELSRRDWYSQFSDDYRYYAAGERHDQVIKALIPKVDPEVVKALWRKYAPKDVGSPV